ncbi:MAG: BLUF domain-containing protein [Bacteroidota bacterium]
MKNIVYVSTAVKLLDDDQLLNILASSRKNNNELNVTGVLLYSEGTFIQALEGDNNDIDFIFSKIEKDLRHKNMITLINEQISQRSFSDWSMGFSTPRAEKLKDVLGYLQSVDSLNANKGTGAAIMTIKTFIESNNLIVTY